MTDQPYIEYDPLSDTIHFHCEATDIEVEIRQEPLLGLAGWFESDFNHHHNTSTEIWATQGAR